MGKKTVTIYFCDICKEEIKEDEVVKCKGCNKEVCKNHRALIKHTIQINDEEKIYENSDYFCSECLKDKGRIKEIVTDLASRTIGQVNIKFSD